MTSRIKGTITGFIDFIRERGVAGFAIGFILGGAVSKLVTAFTTDLINPFVGLLFNSTELRAASSTVSSVNFMWGDFLATLIDFIILAVVVYFLFKVLRIEAMDKQKQ